MNYTNENGTIYKTKNISSAEIKTAVGGEKRLELISEDETVKNYEVQQFSLEEGKYIIDEEYSETVEINGKEYKADRGKVTVPKELSEAEAKIKELEKELEKKDEENKKAIEEFKKNLNTTALALAELYETTMANNA